jgi:hypothetical protein
LSSTLIAACPGTFSVINSRVVFEPAAPKACTSTLLTMPVSRVKVSGTPRTSASMTSTMSRRFSSLKRAMYAGASVKLTSTSVAFCWG